jgi:hypothetical protein
MYIDEDDSTITAFSTGMLVIVSMHYIAILHLEQFLPLSRRPCLHLPALYWLLLVMQA